MDTEYDLDWTPITKLTGHHLCFKLDSFLEAFQVLTHKLI